jgi:hypothetical protein
VIASYVIPEQGGRFIEIDDKNIDVTIVVEIPKGASAAAVRRGYSRARFFD